MPRFVILPLLLLTPWAIAAEPTRPPSTQPAPLPSRVADLQAKLQGKSSRQVLDLVVHDLGQPNRDIGSGLRIPQWDIAGGILTCHPSTGPVFTSADGKRTWLIQTANLLGDNVAGNYEMTTLPDPANHGNRFWIGNVELKPDGTYEYLHHDTNPRQHAAQASNFFIDHPRGSYTLQYAPGLAKDSKLESLDKETTLATLQFQSPASADHPAAHHSLDLRTDPQSRTLSFSPPPGHSIPFQLDKSWRNFWN